MKNAEQKLISEIEKYALFKNSEVEKNRETKRFAALMVEKFGTGMAKGAMILNVNTDKLMARIFTLINEIDPDWDKNRILRWSSVPSDLLLNASELKYSEFELFDIVNSAKPRIYANR